jgi:hypothetical protein
MDQKKYHVRRWRYLAIFLLSVGLGVALYSVAPEFRRPGKFYFLAAVMVLVSPFALWEFVAATDLIFDARGIRYKRRSIGWSEVKAIRVVQQDIQTRMGLIPRWSSRNSKIGDVHIEQRHTSVGYPGLVIPSTTRTDRIVIETTGGNVNINGRSLTLPGGGLIEIAQRMTDLQRTTLGEHGAARARLGVQPAEAPKATVTGVQADRFRRLGLATGEVVHDPQPQAPTPAPAPGPGLSRPGFGRRGLQ